MVMRKYARGKILITLFVVVLVLSACKVNEKQMGEKNQPDGQNQIGISDESSNQNTTGQEEKNVDSEISNELKLEKDVAGGSVYEEDGMIVGAIVLKDTEDAAYAEQVANKYLDKLKVKYPGKRINVQVVGNGKNLANLDFQP